MANEIVLYDLASKGEPHCFSFNAWKARSVLNYKKIPYTTEWVEYPDLEPKLKALGVPPNDPGTSWTDYSSPCIRLPHGTLIMNSAKIIPKLEELYPEPSLHLEANLHPALEEAVTNLAATVWWDVYALLPKRILNPRAAEYIESSRAKIFGATLDECAAAKGGPQAWKTAAAPGGPAEKLAKLLTESKRDEGPFALGSRPSYGDFIVVGVLRNFERVDKGEFEKVLALDPSFGRLYEACSPWFERDN